MTEGPNIHTNLPEQLPRTNSLSDASDHENQKAEWNESQNEFADNIKLRTLTDEVLSMTYSSEFRSYRGEKLPNYLNCLFEIVREKKYFSEPEIKSFVAHFYVAVLPAFNLRLDSDIKASELSQRLQEFLELYIIFSRATKSSKGLLSVKIAEVQTINAQQLESFIKKFGLDVLDLQLQPEAISAEAVVSEILYINARIVKPMSDKERAEAKIDSSLQMRSYAEILKGIKEMIVFQITQCKFLDLRISNRIAIQAFWILLLILESKHLSEAYWEMCAENNKEPFNLNFWAHLITLNCKVDPHNQESIEEIAVGIEQNSHKKDTIMIPNCISDDLIVKTQLLPDPKYANEEALLSLLERFDQLTSEIINNSLDSKNFELITESFIIYLEEFTNSRNSSTFIAAFSARKKIEFYYIIKTLLSTVTSPEQYKRILRIVFINIRKKCLHRGESREEVINLWLALEEIAKLKEQYTCYSIFVQLEGLNALIEEANDPVSFNSMFSIEEMIEIVLRYLSTFKQMITEKRLDVRHQGSEMLDSVWNFLNECSADVVTRYKDYLKQFVDIICGVPSLLYQLMLKEQTVVQIFQKCFRPERRQIIQYLMEKLFKRIQFKEDDENVDTELRKRVFHCLRKYTESLKKHFNASDINEALFANKVFAFIVRFYIRLIEEDNIDDFEAFFNAKPKLVYKESIFDSRRSNDSQMILLTFVEYYDSLLNVATYEILNGKMTSLCILKMTTSILLISPRLHSALSELGCYERLYMLLSGPRNQYTNQEILEICNSLFNLATKGYFYYLVEKPIFAENPDSLEEQIDFFSFAEFAPIWKYIQIKEPFFLSMLLKCLFEWNVSSKIKTFYLQILESMVCCSLSNSGICSQNEVIERLILYFKIEAGDHNKRLLKQVITHVFKVNTNVSRMKAFLRCMRYNYWDYHQNYLNSLISEFARKDFIERMKNVKDFLRIVFDLVEIKIEVLRHSEDAENFINFSGEQSGIIISDLNQSLKSNLTFLISFRIENYISCDKSNIIRNYNILKDQITLENSDNRNSYLTSLESQIHINKDYFENPRMQPDTRVSFIKQGRILNSITSVGNTEFYYPRLFSISSGNVSLELYIGIQSRKHCLVLEGKIREKKGVVKETCEYYDYCPKENEWGTIFVTYTAKNGFQIYQVTNESEEIIKKIHKFSASSFSNIIDAFNTVQEFCIGTSPSKSVRSSNQEHHELNARISVENSFCGQIKKFYLVKKEITEAEMKNIAKQLKIRSENTDTQKDSFLVTKKQKKKLMGFGSKTEEIMDYEQFEAMALLNSNAFPDFDKVSNDEDNQWTLLSDSIINHDFNHEKSKKKKLLFFDRKPDKKHEIKAKGVTYLEKTRFEDVLFSIGNLEIILYAIELLQNFNHKKFENLERHIIFREIIKMIEVLCRSSSKTDVFIFLSQQHGFEFIVRHLRIYVLNFGFNGDCLDSLLELIRSISHPEDRYKGVMRIFLNFDIWKECDFKLKYLVLERVEKALRDPGILYYFKRDHQFITLLYQLQMLMKSETLVDPVISMLKSSTEESSPSKQISSETNPTQNMLTPEAEDYYCAYKDKLRECVFYVLSTPLTEDKDFKNALDPDGILESECEHLVKYLESCGPTAFLLEFLKIVMKLLEIDDRAYAEKIRENLQAQNLKDFITANVYFVTTKRSNSSKRRLTRFAERVLENKELDLLLFYCLQILRMLIFEAPTHDKTGKAAPFLADFLFGATVSFINEKDAVQKQNCSYILKLYNFSLENIEPLTYKALTRSIFYPMNEKNERYLDLKRNLNLIGLIIDKFIKKQINTVQRKQFVKELYVCIRKQRNLKILVRVPNCLHLLHNLINLDSDMEGSDPETRVIVQKLFKRFINYTLFEEEEAVFNLIVLLEFESYLNADKSAVKLADKLAELSLKNDDSNYESSKPLAATNFFKLLKPIEFVLNDCKEQLSKKEESKIPEDSKKYRDHSPDKSSEAAQLKKILLTNISQLVFYSEYFLAKFSKSIVTEESDIFSFTTTLFDFLYATQILHVIYPPIKQIPTELNPSNLLKRYENICYRNGGVLMSMLKILFTVLRFSKGMKEKTELLVCCADVFGLGSRRLSLALPKAKGAVQQGHNVLKDLLAEAAKKYPTTEIKQHLNSPLIETPNADKFPDLLVQKDSLLLYEFCFLKVLKLIVREGKFLTGMKTKVDYEINQQDSYIQNILKTNGNPKQFDIKTGYSVKYSEELVKFLLLLLSVNGPAIRNDLSRIITLQDATKNEPSLKKMKSSPFVQKTSELDTRHKSWVPLIKSELDEFCEDYNEQNKPVKGSPDKNSPHQNQSKVDELLRLCKIESTTGKGQKNSNASIKPIDDDANLLPKVVEFVGKNCFELAKEISPTLRSGNLKPFRFIKRLNFIYFKLQIEKHFDEIKKQCDDFLGEIDPKDSVELFKSKWPIYQERAKSRKSAIDENQKQDEHIRIKINTYWAKKKKQLTDERGVWQIEKRETGLTRYKYGKTEDFLHRRVRLRVDKKASEAVYLSKEAFEETKMKKVDSKSPMGVSMFEPPSTKSQSLICSTFGEQLTMIPVETDETSPVREEVFDVCLEVDADKFREELPEDSDSDLDASTIERDDTLKMMVTPTDVAAPIKKKKKEKKKISKTFKCERITVRGAFWGEIEMTEKYFIFRPLTDERPDDEFYQFGALKSNFLPSSKKKGWNYQKIKALYQRRYHYVRSAFEIFTSDNKAYYFNVYSPIILKEVLTEFKQRSKDVQLYPKENFMETDITKRWVEGKMTNFEYLMHVNMFAGRSFNDLSQYPVFPWIIADHTSEEINIHTTNEKEQKAIFRDLSLPLGAQTEERRKAAKKKIMDLMFLDEEDDEVSIDKLEQSFKKALAEENLFMYGSHYSTGGHIIDYLVRLEPFTSLQIQLQSGKFDDANRIFASIPKAWASYLQLHNTQNFKELIPEFFYCPNFLKNRNNIDFGKDIGMVELPAWAKTPEEFIVKHREALECDYVTKNLDKWIDLIFGFKQYGVEAFRAYNLYSNITYEQSYTMKDKAYQATFLCQVSEFGQCPMQIFRQKHPERKVRDSAQLGARLSYADFIRGEPDPKSIADHSSKTNDARGIVISHLHTFEGDQIVWIHVDKKSLKVIFKNRDIYDIQYEVNLGMIKPFQWAKRKDKTGWMNLGKIIFNDFNINNQICTFGARGAESSYLVIGGYQDNSFKILNKQIGPNPETTIKQSVHFHKRLVTSVACCEHEKGFLIIAGSKDCRISTWRFDIKDHKLQNTTKPKQIIYGHHSEVICLAVESSLGILVSADRDAVVIIHCLLSEKILYTCYPKLELDEEIKSILIDDNGIIAIVTAAYDMKFSNRILIYNINGEALGEFKIDLLHGIRHVSYLEKSKSILLISTKEGQLMTLNLVGNRVLRPLTSFPISYKDSAEELDDSKKGVQKIEGKLKNVAINHFYIDRDSSYVVCGYERGSITIVSPKFHSNKLQAILGNFNDLGFLAVPDSKSLASK